MEHTSTVPAARHDSSFHNNRRLSAGVVQQGTSNAGHDLYNGPVNIYHYGSPKPLPTSTVLFRRDDDFIHRDSLDDICRLCAKPAGCAALVGLGGVGKSQLAIEYAYQVRDESKATWVFWVHAGTHERFKEGYRRIAEATKMDGWDNPKADVLRLVRSWLQNESNGRWLMVVDNADDEAVFFQDAPPTDSTGCSGQPPSELLCDFLPQSPNGSILVTSRSRDAAYKLTGAHSSIVEVKHMDEDAALALLQKKLGYIESEDEAVQLIQALDSMPLALTQAAAFIKMRSPRMSVSKYVDEVRRSEADRARLLNKDVGDSRRDGRASNSIIATWHISFKYIQTKKPNAARLLSLMSFFDRQGIPESLLHDWYVEHGDEGADFDDDIDVLISFSLVEVSWPVCHKLFPHAELVLNSQPEDIEARKAWVSVLSKLAWYACEMGQYKKACDMYCVILQARETMFGSEHADTLNSFNDLGLGLAWLGRYDEAEAMQKKGLEGSIRVLGADHPFTLMSMANLALTYRSQGCWEDAGELYMQVIETSQKKLGADHSLTLEYTAHLASIYYDLGWCEDGEELYMQVLETLRAKLRVGTDQTRTLISMADLAPTYYHLVQWENSEELYIQMLDTSKTRFGDSSLTLESTFNLVSTYRIQGRWKDVEELYIQVLETSTMKLGVKADYLLSLGGTADLVSAANLASTYRKQGRWKDAEELFMQVLPAIKTNFRADHPDTLIVMHNLARTLKARGKINEAIRLMQNYYVLKVKVLGPQHPHSVSTHKRLTRWRLKDTMISMWITLLLSGAKCR